MMTLDVVLLSSLYTIAFVAALRRVPLFPRLLAAIWLIDIVMQLGIANVVAGSEGLPIPVADALHPLLDVHQRPVAEKPLPAPARAPLVRRTPRRFRPRCRLACRHRHRER